MGKEWIISCVSEADSDELRAVAEESAEGLREHFTGKNRANQKRDSVESCVAGCGMTPTRQAISCRFDEW